MSHVVVVGGGTAGSIVARRLLDGGHRVTLLEAGGEDVDPAIHDPAGLPLLWHGENDWDYSTTPQEHGAGRRLHLPRGKVLGGSHALNAMIWVRCSPLDYDDWAAAGNTGWSWADVLPVYKQIESYDGGASELRGGDGLLPVVGEYPLVPIQASIIEAAVQEGLEHNPDYNGDHLEGVSQQQVTLVDGKRVNTWMTYLQPVRDRVEIVTGAHVHSVIVEGGAVTGLRFRRAGVDEELAADAVVLAAGALDSPAILLRSGIGPREELEALGIDPLVDAPAVGANLHDHLLSPVIFTTTSKEVAPPTSGVSVTQSHLFWTSREGLDRPDTQPIHFSVPMFDDDLPPKDGVTSGFSLMAGLVTPKSRGRLTLSGPGLEDPVNIDLNILDHDDDVASLVASLTQCRSIGRRPALAEEWGAVEVYPGAEVGDDELEDYVRRTAITYHHQVGTCRMGVDAEAVVDPRLRVNGVTGLRVIDASIMPTITTGNTNAPAALIGELGARFLLEDLAEA